MKKGVCEMSEMRKCKECGKLFMPTGREQYCSDDHYRPCPICGKPVIAKYLSDPPRKCDECKHIRSKGADAKFVSMKPKSLFKFGPDDSKSSDPFKQAEVKPEKVDKPAAKKDKSWAKDIDTKIPEKVDQAIFCEDTTGSIRMYIGNPHGDRYFIPGHKYVLRVEHNAYTYRVTSTEDVTAGEPVMLVSDYASQISFYQNFAKLREN